jgi:hypothetical protein
MTWARSNLQVGVRLALAALAIQLCLSFAHVHLIGFQQTQSQLVSSVDASDADDTDSKSPLAAHDPICVVCALTQLVAHSDLPLPPALELPQSFNSIDHATFVATARSAPPNLLFNARAPPQARRYG